MLMDSFEVENFRSLKHLKLEKLARVNLLVGKNNSGKTSVLEGMYALRNIRHGEWLKSIEKERGIGKETGDFRQLFYGFDGSINVHLAATYAPIDKTTQGDAPFLDAILSLVRSPAADWSVRRGNEHTTKRSTANALGIAVKLSNSLIPQPILFDLRRADDSDMFFISISPDAEIFLNNPVLLPRHQGTELITTSIDRLLLSQKLEGLKISKQEEPLLRVMQQIDPRIKRIELVSGGQIYLDVGFTSLTLLNLMGEGIQRLLDVATAIAQMAGGVVLIDEIDNGLHYSALRILWKGILQAAREYDVQIVATTHSAEALRHLTWVLNEEENASYRDDVAAYTLIRAKDDTVRSYRYNYEQLEFAMEHDIEVRN